MQLVNSFEESYILLSQLFIRKTTSIDYGLQIH